MNNNLSRRIINTFIIVAIMAPSFTPFIPTATARQPEEFQEKEVLEKRTENAKVFQIEENEYRMEVGVDRIHYNSGGSWVNIDSNIIISPKDQYKYKNTANDFTFRAGAKLSDGVYYSGPQGVCEFKLSSADNEVPLNATGTYKDNVLTYKNIYPGADLEFTVDASGVYTEVVYRNAVSMDKEIEFELTNCEETIFAPAIMMDELDGAEVEQEVYVDEEGKKKLKLKPDYSKLGEIDGEVRVDPSITRPAALNVYASQYSRYGGTRRFLAVGKFYDTTVPAYFGRTESYLKFNFSIPSTAYVEKAQLSLRRYANGGASFNAKASRLTQSFSSSTGTYKNDYKSKTSPYNVITVDYRDWDMKDYRWNLTQMVQEWVQGTYPNYGVALYSDTAAYKAGAAFCSSRTDSFCTSTYVPKLYITYYENQKPDTPNPIAPQNQAYYSGNCDESVPVPTGTCRIPNDITFQSKVNDPDTKAQLDMKESWFRYINHSVDPSYKFKTAVYPGDGWTSITHNQTLVDGAYEWWSASIDKKEAYSNQSQHFRFTTDTTPPVVPILDELPAMTKAVGSNDNVQIEATAANTTDIVANNTQIGYVIQYSSTADFSANVYEKLSQYFAETTPRFELGPKGVDETAGTGDDLNHDGTYYLRVKAHDIVTPAGEKNTSAWSNVVWTQIDGTRPIINSLTSDIGRISPNNDTSVGIADSTNFEIQFTEENIGSVQILIHSDEAMTNLIQTLDISIDSLEDLGANTYKGLITWNGKDSSGSFVQDGSYTALAKVTDIATNISDNTHSHVLVVDNSPAPINITSPQNNHWINAIAVNITGQMSVPHVEGLEDQDFVSAQSKLPTEVDWKDITLDGDNIFNYSVPTFYGNNLALGQNNFDFKSVDTVGNTHTFSHLINVEQTNPVLDSINDAVVVSSITEPINFTLTDPDPTEDGLEQSGIPTGINPDGLELKLWYYDETNTLIYKSLIKDGVNLDTVLVEDVNCTAVTGADTYVHNQRDATDSAICAVQFKQTPDVGAVFGLDIIIEDIAGNSVHDNSLEFLIDNYVHSELLEPTNNSLYASDTITFSGKASKGAILTLINTQLGTNQQFTVDENLDGTGLDGIFLMSNFSVTCGEMYDHDNLSATPLENLCTWEIQLAQSSSLISERILNNNLISVEDDHENRVNHTVDVFINLFELNLEISTDLVLFSPNGDGEKDSIKFFHETNYGEADGANSVGVENYTVAITNEQGDVIREYTGTNLPSYTLFDGNMEDPGNPGEYIWIEDGLYSIKLELTTDTGITLASEPINITAKSTVDRIVTITNPVDGHITTEGVITITGTAPIELKLDGENVTVEICVDTITTPHNNITCDERANTTVDAMGNFSAIIVLPRITKSKITEHIISAVATDGAGNTTEKSNTVSVILDTLDPFTYVQVAPAIVGSSDPELYALFLAGDLGIDELHGVMIEAGVSEYTEGMEINYADYVYLTEKPDDPNYRYIGTFNNQTETDADLNPWTDPSIKHNYQLPLGNEGIEIFNCDESGGCVWKYFMPIPPSLGGVYEVELKGLKGETLQSMTAGFRVDGSIPTTPVIMIVERWDEDMNDGDGGWVRLDNLNNLHFADTTRLRFRGAAQPGTYLELIVNDIVAGSVTVNETGLFEIIIDLEPFFQNIPGNGNGNGKGLECREWLPGAGNERKCLVADLEFDLISYETDEDGNPTDPVDSDDTVFIGYDEKRPTALEILGTIPETNLENWVKSGDQVSYYVLSDENLSSTEIHKADGFLREMMSTGSLEEWSGVINIDTKFEGFYPLIFKLIDKAGNLSYYESNNWDSDGLRDYRLFVDNTQPDETVINISEWSTTWEEGGINADKTNPEAGRTNPEYVISSDTIEIKGRAEKNQRIELQVNNEFITYLDVTNENCTPDSDKDADKLSKDNKVTKYADKCDWSYIYTFEDDGSGDWDGVPDYGYTFQVRTIDKAGNVSDFTKQEIIYHDLQAPRMPEVLNAFSTSYNPIIDWSKNGASSPVAITKDMKVSLASQAERFSDMQYTQISPGSLRTEYDVFPNSTNMKYTKSFNLGDQTTDNRTGCTTMVGNRRTGTCNDGVYYFNLGTTDAAGNGPTILSSVKVERDTVAPKIPSVQIEAKGDIIAQNLALTVNGESNAKLLIKVQIDDSNEILYLNKRLDSSGRFATNNLINQLRCPQVKYKVSAWLTDRAGNRSEMSLPKTIRTLDCPSCGFGDGEFQVPIHDGHVRYTSEFGIRFLNGVRKMHYGLDMSNGIYGTPIYASAPGRVIQSNYNINCNGGVDRDCWDYGYANSVKIDHGGGVVTVYGHLLNEKSGEGWVQVGDRVTPGTQIGRMGSMGASTGAHLHFTVKVNGISVNPRSYLGEKTNLTPEQYEEICQEIDPDELAYTPVPKQEAVDVFEKFIKDELKNTTEIGDDSPGSTYEDTELKNIKDLRSELDVLVHDWCGVWVLDMGEVFEAKGMSGYGGHAYDAVGVYNPDDKQVLLIKNGIWEKYHEMGGPCSPLGIPREEYGHYSETHTLTHPDSRAATVAIQFFEKDIYRKNSIYWYGRGNTNEDYGAFSIYGTIADKYHGSTPGETGHWKREYGLPIGDTTKTDCALYQEFEFGEIDLCTDITKPFSVKNTNPGWRIETGVLTIDPDFDKDNRWVWFNMEGNGNTKKFNGENVWVVIHGWEPNPSEGWAASELTRVAEGIMIEEPDAIVLVMNWAQASQGKFIGCSRENLECNMAAVYEATPWIRPVAREAADKLREWGMTNEDATTKLNFAGHSLGTYMSVEIAREMDGANNSLALDTAAALATEYDLDGNTNGTNKLNYTDYLRKQFNFSRSFVGERSIAGSTKLSKTANESYIIDYDTPLLSTIEHRMVVNTLGEYYRSQNKIQNLDETLFSLNRTWTPANSVRLDGVREGHEGIITIGNVDEDIRNETGKPVIASLKTKNSETASIRCNSSLQKVSQFGTSGSDNIDATESCHEVYAGSGNDTIKGAATHTTTIYGGTGEDIIMPSSGYSGIPNLEYTIGGSESDAFVLGINGLNYYTGSKRHLSILDFTKDDKIMLGGDKSDYSVVREGPTVKILDKREDPVAIIHGSGIDVLTRQELNKGDRSSYFIFSKK